MAVSKRVMCAAEREDIIIVSSKFVSAVLPIEALCCLLILCVE